jgi:hypothetical protein
MKNLHSFYHIAQWVLCVTFVLSFAAAALPQPALAAPTTDSKLIFKARLVNDKLYIDIDKYPVRTKYQIKLRAPNAPKQFYKVGSVRVPKNTAVSTVRELPKQLKAIPFVEVCLKNQINDKVNCLTIPNP